MFYVGKIPLESSVVVEMPSRVSTSVITILSLLSHVYSISWQGFWLTDRQGEMHWRLSALCAECPVNRAGTGDQGAKCTALGGIIHKYTAFSLGRDHPQSLSSTNNSAVIIQMDTKGNHLTYVFWSVALHRHTTNTINGCKRNQNCTLNLVW